MKGCIFDLDGTLLDSLGVWAQIDVDFFAKRSMELPPDYFDAIAALSLYECAEYTIARFGFDETPESLVNEWREMAIEAYAGVKLKPGAKEFLFKLKAAGVKLAVATSCLRELFTPALKANGVYCLFDAVCTVEESGAAKRDPALYLLAAERLGLKPEDCVLFEDVPEALEAAKATGMKTAGVFDENAKDTLARLKEAAGEIIFDWRDYAVSFP
jgi:HAD superfamily hydrolase (TIGR01509 family)